MRTRKSSGRGKPDPALLADIVDRVVSAARPEKIVLFGSAARGAMGPNSDIDLLVIKAGKFDHWRLMAMIYRRLRGDGAAVDVVLATPEDVERYRDTHCLVICPALREGTVIYDAQAIPARRSATRPTWTRSAAGSRRWSRGWTRARRDYGSPEAAATYQPRASADGFAPRSENLRGD